MKPMKPVKMRANLTHRSRLARRAGKWSRLFKLATLMVLGALAYTVHVNRADQLGAVGVVGSLAQGFDLSCGGKYNPLAGKKTPENQHPAESLEIFHPTLPCGSKVMITNPANGNQALAVVANQRVAFNPGQGRTADISVATAQVLGLNPAKTAPVQLSLRALTGKGAGFISLVPVVTSVQKQPETPAEISEKDLTAFAKNLVHECGGCSIYGMIGVGQVTQNRVEHHFRHKSNYYDVIYDGSDTDSPQFTWTYKPKVIGKLQMAAAKKLSRNYLQSRLSGNLLATQYLVTRDALNYFQYEQVFPYWAKNGRGLEVVPMLTSVEALLEHRYLRPATGGLQVASN